MKGMAPSPRRVALFGGTFDPIHIGHLAAARAAVASGHVDEVHFIPAGAPPHKPAGPRVSASERWLMTVLATLDEPRFRVARWEIDRPGPSYAVDTVSEARRALEAESEAPVELYWVIGTDAMALIDTWHRVEELFALTRFLVIARRGFDEAQLRAHLATTVPWASPDRLVFEPMDLVDVSSTALRSRLAEGEQAPVGLPPLVAAYVERYGLYQPTREVAR